MTKEEALEILDEKVDMLDLPEEEKESLKQDYRQNFSDEELIKLATREISCEEDLFI